MIEERIKALINKRTIEASKKEISKKLQTIVKAFGKPIINHAVSYTMLPDFWEIQAPEIPEVTDDCVYLQGYYFDGLSRGANLCIKVTIYDNQMSELLATYNGYRVFLESEGELKSYAPFSSWEDALDRIYLSAKGTADDKVQEEKLKQKEADKKKALSIAQKLRLLWGL